MGVNVRWAWVLPVLAAVVWLAAAPGSASAHEERTVSAPDGSGRVPTYRTGGPRLLVCKADRPAFEAAVAAYPAELRDRNLSLWQECQRSGYRDLQEAVNAATQPGMTILVLPGTYLEEPSLAEPSGECANLDARWSRNRGYQVLTFEQQQRCPHNQNLVAVLGKRDLQIEGTGATAGDVVIDARFQRLNAIRADRSDGFYIRNLTVQRTTFNALYIMETDGFVIDGVVGRWNNEYAFLTFAVDHGVYTGCEAYGNGDSGIYPGAAHDINRQAGRNPQRYAVEVRGCRSHHNTLGYAGTAGDSVWVHDSEFTENSVGVGMDSLFPHHPGMPQNHALFERNVIADNNSDYLAYVRDGTCAKPMTERGLDAGVVCPKIAPWVGSGVLVAGGNDNVFRNNWIYGNKAVGYMSVWVPGFVREDTHFGAQFDTTHHNAFYRNRLGVDRAGTRRPNGSDYWTDGQGVGNCWQAPSADSNPIALPRCGREGLPVAWGTHRYFGEPAKTVKAYVCLSNSDVAQNRLAANCEWFGARGLARIEVQHALIEAVLLAGAFAALCARRLRRSVVTGVGFGTALAGLTIGVLGSAWEATPLTPIGLALLGAGWALVGVRLRRQGYRWLGWLTLGLAVLSLLGAIDRGLWMLPFIPLAPTWIRVVGELIWVPWVLTVATRRPSTAAADLDTRQEEPVAAV